MKQKGASTWGMVESIRVHTMDTTATTISTSCDVTNEILYDSRESLISEHEEMEHGSDIKGRQPSQQQQLLNYRLETRSTLFFHPKEYRI